MISEHISEKEAVKSITALRLGIDNTPDGDSLNNMKILAEKIFEPLRKWVGGPIKINSMYRSIALNQAIGGSSRSQHCQGRAVDLMMYTDIKQTKKCLTGLNKIFHSTK